MQGRAESSGLALTHSKYSFPSTTRQHRTIVGKGHRGCLRRRVFRRVAVVVNATGNLPGEGHRPLVRANRQPRRPHLRRTHRNSHRRRRACLSPLSACERARQLVATTNVMLDVTSPFAVAGLSAVLDATTDRGVLKIWISGSRARSFRLLPGGRVFAVPGRCRLRYCAAKWAWFLIGAPAELAVTSAVRIQFTSGADPAVGGCCEGL